MLVAYKNSANLFQHESKPLLEKLKNKDSQDDITKELEKVYCKENISVEQLSSQLMTTRNQGIVQPEPRMSYNFYKIAFHPSNVKILKSIADACRDRKWTRTKMNDFWRMRKDLGEPKTS